MYIKILSFLLFFCACTIHFNYYSSLTSLLTLENYQKAEIFLEENKLKNYGEKNILLYWLDKGILLHYAGKFEDSILAFNNAEKVAEQLYTKSISTEFSTFLLSDDIKPYYGEDFEKIFINVFQALNYIFLNKHEEALVEARKVDHKLKTLQVNYEGKNVYKEDAFMRYLTGLLYESQGDFNDAFISYIKAIKEYSTNYRIYSFDVPKDLLYRTLKIAKRLGFKEEFKEISEKYNLNLSWQDVNLRSKEGEILIFHYNGFAPYKVDQFIEVSFGEGWGYVGIVEFDSKEDAELQRAKQIARSISSYEQFLVAFPKFIPVKNKIKYVVYEFYNENGILVSSEKSFLVEDIETLAVETLKDKILKIKAKTIARAAIKYALSKEIKRKVEEKTKDKFTNWIVDKTLKVASVITEQADKRSWRMLPKEINLAVAVLPEGVYKIEAKFYDKKDKLIFKKTFKEVKISSNQKVFLAIRTYI